MYTYIYIYTYHLDMYVYIDIIYPYQPYFFPYLLLYIRVRGWDHLGEARQVRADAYGLNLEIVTYIS